MKLTIFFRCLQLLLAAAPAAAADCNCWSNLAVQKHLSTLHLKLVAIGTILFAGAIGVCLPIIGRSIPAFGHNKNLIFLIKAFAAGVILATGLVHILPDAFDRLSSLCLEQKPWGEFPLAGFVVMLSAIWTMMVDTLATGYHMRTHFIKARPVINSDEEQPTGEHVGHVHTHMGHVQSHESVDTENLAKSEIIKNRIISQVLELGIVVHSVIIGVSLGTTKNPSTVRPLVGALSFHQLFEGMGLGGCIVQAKFRIQTMVVMALFFSLTTPLGVAVGIAVSSVYDNNSVAGLIVEGVFLSASAGILIYMALVDLLAADHMNPRMQGNVKLQLWSSAVLLLGAGCMSLMAKWA